MSHLNTRMFCSAPASQTHSSCREHTVITMVTVMWQYTNWQTKLCFIPDINNNTTAKQLLINYLLKKHLLLLKQKFLKLTETCPGRIKASPDLLYPSTIKGFTSIFQVCEVCSMLLIKRVSDTSTCCSRGWLWNLMICFWYIYFYRIPDMVWYKFIVQN